MFTLRYFAPAYFAPAYFAEIGAPPAPPPPATSGVLVKVSTIPRPFAYDPAYGTPIAWQLIRGQRSAATVPFCVSPATPFSPQLGETIEIFDPPATRVWAGTIEAVGIKWIGDDGWHVITCSAVSLERYYDSFDLGGVKYAGVSCGAAFTDIFYRVGVPGLTLGIVDDGPLVVALTVGNAKTGFDDLGTFAGCTWYIDPIDLTVNFHADTSRASAVALGATGTILYETMDWTQSRSNVRDQQVIQPAAEAMTPTAVSFSGDGTTTEFDLPAVPLYIISATVVPTGLTGKAFNWTQGTVKCTVTPAMLDSETLQISFMGSGAQTAVLPGPAPLGGPSFTSSKYTKTRTYTKDGALQEANALLARYGRVPSQLVLSTDVPGVEIARVITLDVYRPKFAGDLLNGKWIVQQIDASNLPYMERLESPWGHFRHKLTLINVASVAVFQGDGSTTVFILPGPPEPSPTPPPVVNVTVAFRPGELGGSPGDYLPYHLSYSPPPDGTGLLTIDNPPLPPGVCAVITVVTPAVKAASAAAAVAQAQVNAAQATLGAALSGGDPLVILAAEEALTVKQDELSTAQQSLANAQNAAPLISQPALAIARDDLVIEEATYMAALASGNQAAIATALIGRNNAIGRLAHATAEAAATAKLKQEFCGDGVQTQWPLTDGGSPPLFPDAIDNGYFSNLPDSGFNTNATPTAVTVTPPPCGNITLAIGYTVTDPYSPSYGQFVSDAYPVDCQQTTFPLSQGPGQVASVMTYTTETSGEAVSVTPALPPGSTVYSSYVGNQAPDVVNNYSAWAQLTEAPPASAAPNQVVLPPSQYVIGLLLKDLTVGDDIADHVTIYHDGTALRLLGVLRKLMTEDLTVRINKRNATFTTEELIVATIPVSAVVDQVFEWSLASGSPPTLPPFLDKEVLSVDILGSDGSTDVDGIAAFTVEWEQTH